MAYSTFSGPSWQRASSKHLSLILLIFQNSGLILIMHYSRIMPLVDGHRYLPSTAVLISEIIKLSISLTMALADISVKEPNLPATTLFQSLFTSIFSSDSWKLSIPALLYTLQNSLQYIAVSNLDASTFQITYQLKILTTALFSVALLGRSLSIRKWLSLLFLTVGVAIVQIPTATMIQDTQTVKGESRSEPWLQRLFSRSQNSAATKGLIMKRSATYQGIDEDFALQNPHLNGPLGLVAVLVACVSSGFAGVYFEKVLKESNNKAYYSGNRPTTSLWIRNTQLSFYSILPALLIGVWYKDGDEIARNGLFAGYNWVVWTTIVVQAMGGIIVALVISQSNNIAKNFATSISILISFVFSIFFFDLSITFHYLLGTCIVMGATWLYNMPDGRRKPEAIVVDDYEKHEVSTRSEPGYFDILTDSPRMPRTPMGREGAFSSSRPGTPSLERGHYRPGSDKKQVE